MHEEILYLFLEEPLKKNYYYQGYFYSIFNFSIKQVTIFENQKIYTLKPLLLQKRQRTGHITIEIIRFLTHLMHKTIFIPPSHESWLRTKASRDTPTI